ncbi:uncharacterized protein LOC135940450 isoform X2 [Cloeon dipterum]
MAKASGAQQGDQKLIELSKACQYDESGGPLALLNVNDIRQPDASTVCKFYSKYLGDIGIEIPEVADLPAYQNVQHPEIHRTMLQYGLLAKAMQFFLNNINSNAIFTITDVISPTPNRHRAFLAELLNAQIFGDSIREQVLTAGQNWQKSEEKTAKLREELEGLQNRKSQLLVEKGLREDKVKNFEKRMESANQQCKKLTSDMGEHRQRVTELQQELDEHIQKHMQTAQSKEFHATNLKKLECQIVNSPQRVKQDLSMALASLNTVTAEVTERESILTSRQNTERFLAEYIQVLKDVEESATQMGELKKISVRTITRMNELMNERTKLMAANDKISKENVNASERLNALQQKLAQISQSRDRLIDEMMKTLQEYEDEEQNMLNDQDVIGNAIRTYEVDKLDLNAALLNLADYETEAVHLLNDLHVLGTENVYEEANVIMLQKFEQLKDDFGREP